MHNATPAIRRSTIRPAAGASPRSPAAGSVAQRLDTLRRTSGGLSHDFNNLLGVILSASERLADDLPVGGEHQRLALLALEAAERGAELVRRSLALTRERQPPPRAVDTVAALETVRRMARHTIDPKVRLKVFMPAEPLLCLGDRTGLEMALLNLCLNAGQATPRGGAITLRARAIGPDRAQRLGLPAQPYAAFTVRDTGAGMAPETLAHATEALFTTKATGTGLGLSSVLEFATAAGGTLSLWSRQGHGTTATLYLPLAATAAGVVGA